MTKPVEVTAEVVEDNAIVRVDFTPATITVDYDAIRAKIMNMVEPYMGLSEDQWAAVDMKECKASRAHMNKIVKDINDSRKLVTKTYMEPLKQLEDFCKEISGVVKDCSATVDAAIKTRETREKEYKRQQLEDYFLNFCSDNGFRALTESVTFDAIMDASWLNKSFAIKKAQAAIEAKTLEIMQAWQTLSNSQLYDRDGAMLTFFKTLSVTAALNYDADRKAQQERLEAFEAEQGMVREYREPEPVEAPEPEQVPIEAYANDTEEPVYSWEVTVDCTRTQLYQLRDIMLQMGLDPHARKVVG